MTKNTPMYSNEFNCLFLLIDTSEMTFLLATCHSATVETKDDVEQYSVFPRYNKTKKL